MATRIIRTTDDRANLIRLLEARELPFTVSVAKGASKSHEQDRLENMWHREAADQLQDETAEEKRAYSKLHFGVPILRSENDVFREQYDRVLKPHAYEDKLRMMAAPIDFPITRLMTSKQKSSYLDALYQHYRGQGVQVTEPGGEL